jgi:aminotransferase
VTEAIRKVHDFLTVGAPAPLQEAVAVGIETMGRDYYDALARDYQRRRDLLCDGLRAAGFRLTPPQGAYYVLADFSDLSELSDTGFSYWLTEKIGVAPVPGSSFFSRPALGNRLVRFAFCKTDEMLKEAAGRLQAVRRFRG